MKILVDEMYDGLDEKLIRNGFEALSIKKLKKENSLLNNDFNIISFANQNKMILITGDKETGKSCKDNGFPCIFVSDDLILEKIILPELKLNM
jgi:hypothetical protein